VRDTFEPFGVLGYLEASGRLRIQKAPTKVEAFQYFITILKKPYSL